MNTELFAKLMKEGAPKQHPPEWQTFLEICEMYLRKNRIENPVVVELGIWRDHQKKFYEKLLGAYHIGIDIANDRSTPDIHGSTHDPKTLMALKEKLDGRAINILFIDASHQYKNVKRDFEIYSPLCNDIIAIHDIELGRYQSIRTREVWKFWDELKSKAHKETRPYVFCPESASVCPLKAEMCPSKLEKYKSFLFISIHQYRDDGDKSQKGIGLIMKK